MKVLCFIDSLGSGGAQRQLVELAKGFKEMGYEVSFLTYHNINFFKPELDALDISVQIIIEPNYLKRLFKIRKEIRKHRPNVVISFLEAANFMATFAGFPFRKWQLVVGERSANPQILKSYKLRFYRWFHLFTDYVVANSHKNMELVSKVNLLLGDKKKKVIYNIVKVPPLKEITRENKNKTRIVIAASYRPVKNLDGLIEAVNSLPLNYKEKLEVQWYGNKTETPYLNAALKMIDNYNLCDCIYLNEATNVIYDKYQKADFIGLFSHYEGFPNTICEGMAIGKPIIASKVSDLPLLLNENENGIFCHPNDITSIKSALIKAINLSEIDKEEMGARNKLFAAEKFNKQRICNEYLKLF